MLIATSELSLEHVPGRDSSDIDIIRLAQALNGYDAVGGEAAELGAYVAGMKEQPVDSLSLNDLRILLFARQRAHYFEGGGWSDGDPIMDEMRIIAEAIRQRLADGG